MWGWLSDFLEQFVDLVPRHLIVTPDERVIEFVAGRWGRTLEPGWYVQWPIAARYETIYIQRRTIEGTQRFGRKAINWTVVAKIDDAFSACTETADLLGDIRGYVEMYVSDVYGRDNTCPYDVDARKRMVRRVRKAVQVFGVRILDFRITGHSVADRQFSIWELAAKPYLTE